MGKQTWVVSDTHFSHKLMAELRGFASPQDMDEVLIQNWNSLVKPHDRVYHLGDFCINRAAIKIAALLNGNIVLVKGNHDIFKLSDYMDYFEDIRAYKVLPSSGVILSHIPIHPGQLSSRFVTNAHGHTHERSLSDARYVNVCVEKTLLRPVPLDDIIEYSQKVREREEENA